MKKLAVLIVHGMGDQDSDFADEMIDELESRIRSSGLDPNEIEWRPVWWAPVLSSSQADQWRRSRRRNDLDYKKLRSFVIHALGDAVTYRRVASSCLSPGSIDTYTEIHDQIEKDVRTLRDRTRDGKPAGASDVRLVVIAHLPSPQPPPTISTGSTSSVSAGARIPTTRPRPSGTTWIRAR